MGCVYSKVVSACEYVLKKLKRLGQQFLGGNAENVAGLNKECMMASNTFLKPYNGECGLESVGNVLLRALGVSDRQERQILVLSFEEKPQLEQENILIYIYMNWQDLQQDSSVIEALKETKFVASAGGDLYKPKELFDPGDTLLTSVFSSEVQKFPGQRFASDGWLNILRKTGLQNTGDADTVLECARRVELLGAESMKPLGLVDDNTEDFIDTKAEVSSEIWSLAETLVSAICENFAVLNNNINFCNIFGTIACIPAEKGFPFESGKKGVKRVLCSYSEAILLKDWALAWRVAPILSTESLIPPEYSWGALQLRSPPPFTVVLKHLKAHDVHTDSSLLTMEEAAFEVLRYLDRLWDTLSSSDVSELCDLAIVPVANAKFYVNPVLILSFPTIDLFPLAFELPSLYLPFVKILKEMGLQDVLSVSSAMSILSSLQRSIGYQRLCPNLLHAVMRILHFVYNEITEQKDSNISDWESCFCVPDDSCRLVHPTSCVYMDPYGSRYVKYIDCSQLRFVHQDVSEKLCLFFGVRKLADVVVEELDCAEHLHTLEEIGGVSLAAIKQRLLSRSFQVAVFRVFNTVSSNTTGSGNPDFHRLQGSLESIAKRLKFVQSICIRFLLLPKSLDITHVSKKSIIPKWNSRSTHQVLYFVDRSNTCMLISKPPSYIMVLDLVSAVVSHVLGLPVSLPISSLFLCPHDSETALVNILKLSTDEKEMDGLGSDTGFLGRDILPEDAMQVQFKPSRPFYKGEIVAWQRKKGDKLKYGRIQEDVKPSAGQGLYRLNIETSPAKTETIISSHVFWFTNFSFGHVVPEDGDNVVSSERVDQPKGSGRVKGQPIKELEHGSVSVDELIQVVEGIVSGAGIRIDTEEQCLQKILSLQERLKESQEALMLEQEKSKIATDEAYAARERLLCRICMSNEINITIIPCGHVLCRKCSYVVSNCPFCQVPLLNRLEINGHL